MQSSHPRLPKTVLPSALGQTKSPNPNQGTSPEKATDTLPQSLWNPAKSSASPLHINDAPDPQPIPPPHSSPPRVTALWCCLVRGPANHCITRLTPGGRNRSSPPPTCTDVSRTDPKTRASRPDSRQPHTLCTTCAPLPNPQAPPLRRDPPPPSISPTNRSTATSSRAPYNPLCPYTTTPSHSAAGHVLSGGGNGPLRKQLRWGLRCGGQAPTVPKKNLLCCGMLRRASSRWWGVIKFSKSCKSGKPGNQIQMVMLLFLLLVFPLFDGMHQGILCQTLGKKSFISGSPNFSRGTFVAETSG